MKLRLFSGGLLSAGTLMILAVLFMSRPASVSSTGRGESSKEYKDQACWDCHTSETRLKELAPMPEEPAESLSSGPG